MLQKTIKRLKEKIRSQLSTSRLTDPLVQITGKPLVVDNGTEFSRNGYGGEDQPRSVFPTLVGYPKYQSIMSDVDHYTREYYVGEEAMNLRGVLKLIYPIEHGVITDWGAMEKLWDYTFHDLRANASEHPVLLTEAPLNPSRNREKMAEIMFETFNVPAINVSMQAVLSLHASGRATGLVVDAGHDIMYIVPVYEGFAITNAIERIRLGGRDISEYLRRLLRGKGFTWTSSAEKEIVRDVKERFCYATFIRNRTETY